MTNREILEAFFRAENERDWETYRTFLDPGVEWQLFGKEEKTVSGIEEYMRVIQRAYEDTDVQFSCRELELSKDGNRAVTFLVSDSGMRSLDIFDFKDGRIYREYEFLLD